MRAIALRATTSSGVCGGSIGRFPGQAPALQESWMVWEVVRRENDEARRRTSMMSRCAGGNALMLRTSCAGSQSEAVAASRAKRALANEAARKAD